jgi:flagellar basal-body rod protein FlgF
MNVSLYQAAAAMNAQTRWQEMITENMAAGNVPGFRKQQISFADVAATSPMGMNGVTPTGFTIPVATTSTNFQQGEFRPTGSSTDFAIDGPGFFEVQLPDGSKAYTRNGEFQLNSRGQLTTKRGNLVLSSSGPLQFDPNNPSPVTVSATGQVSQGSNPKGQLRLVQFSDPNQLVATANGCLQPQNGETPRQADKMTTVHQGFLESSNSSPVMEMGSLITAMRLFEANQKVLQTQDERMGKAISDLSGTS